jgi:ankyrin repeat protein
MSVNMGPSLKERIAADPSFMTSPDDRGWTLLHHLALAGSTTGIRVLLEAGADPNVKTAKGFTAAQLARTLGWVEVIKLLEGD